MKLIQSCIPNIHVASKNVISYELWRGEARRWKVQEYMSNCVRGLLQGKDESMRTGIPKVAETRKKGNISTKYCINSILQ